MRRLCMARRAARPHCSPRPARWWAGTTTSGDDSKRVVLVTHESFVMSKELQKQFEDESGYDLVVKASGDAGQLTNKLVLTKDDRPATRCTASTTRSGPGRSTKASSRRTPRSCRTAQTVRAGGEDDHELTPVDKGNVCVNVDDAWFADHDVPVPQTLDDLVNPAYEDLFVTPGATTSSPGSRSCSPPSPSTAGTAGRRTGAS